MSYHIAIVEDEPAILDNYVEALRRQGYQVSGYRSRPEASAAFQNKLPDLVIIDIGLGDEYEGGFELCRQLRARSASLPIMFLTARDSDLDVISGLRLGADDYLSKDISLAHLSARITTLFRRLQVLKDQSQASNRELRVDALLLDPDTLDISWREQAVPLTITEFWMLHSLVKRPGHVKSRDQLMEEANVLVDDATVTSHIKRIRRKFLAIDAGFDQIETVYGAGYRWKRTR